MALQQIKKDNGVCLKNQEQTRVGFMTESGLTQRAPDGGDSPAKIALF